jgi:hypothetical protein
MPSSANGLFGLVKKPLQIFRVAANRPSISTLQHFACTGGTLISKCVAALPQVYLLSEIDPLSTMVDLHSASFAPTDLILNIRRHVPPISDNALVNIFVNSIAGFHAELQNAGKNLVIREHTHSHFCTEVDPFSRPSVRNMLSQRFTVNSIITVRHPLDSYLSLDANKWINFHPFNLDEYCRRYLLFLDDSKNFPILKYEDFLNAPQLLLAKICTTLKLKYSDDALTNFRNVKISGDSGRSSAVIAPRPRREIPSLTQNEAFKSLNYRLLCDRLKYQP